MVEPGERGVGNGVGSRGAKKGGGEICSLYGIGESPFLALLCSCDATNVVGDSGVGEGGGVRVPTLEDEGSDGALG